MTTAAKTPQVTSYCTPSPCPPGVSVTPAKARASDLVSSSLLLPGAVVLAGAALVVVDRRLAGQKSP